MKKLIAILVFCLFNLVSYSQVIHPLNWGMTQEEVTTAMKNNDCHLDSVDYIDSVDNTLITYNIVSYCNFQVDYVKFQFNENYNYGLTSITFWKRVNTLKKEINLRYEWKEHFGSYYQKFMDGKYIAYYIFDDNYNYIGIITIYKEDDNKYTVMFINTYR